MGTTPNYNFNVPVGSDIVNLLTQNNPNWEALDTILKTISNTGVGTATELKTGTVHSLTRSDTDRKVFTFVATTNFVAGETFLLDGDQVTALTASGEQLSTGCYVIGSNVLVSVHDTLLTFYVPESTAKDAQKLGGELPSHYATESDLEEIQTDMSAVEAKLGTGVFQTQAQNAVDAVNELNTHLSWTSLGAVIGQSRIDLDYDDYNEWSIGIYPNDDLNRTISKTISKGIISRCVTAGTSARLSVYEPDNNTRARFVIEIVSGNTPKIYLEDCTVNGTSIINSTAFYVWAR